MCELSDAVFRKEKKEPETRDKKHATNTGISETATEN